MNAQRLRLNVFAAASLLAALLVATTSHAVIIDMVTVGDPGNADDSTGYGGVSYTYNISKYDVTNAQYAEFLNAVAATDTYALYNDYMVSAAHGGITRTGSSGSYTYTVKSGYANLPVVYVSFYDSIRFINWLNNGQGAGSTETGAYTITGGGADSGTIGSRESGASFWLPSEDEWYKAAYYDPTKGGGGYWLYPMQTDSVPYSDQAPGSGSPDPTMAGNFRSNDSIANGYNDGYAVTGSTSFNSALNYLTGVGAYTTADSYYGTFDQGGLVWEWNEAIIGLQRGIRGGAWAGPAINLRATVQNSNDPAPPQFLFYDGDVGFRVAGLFISEFSAVPEPSTVFLLLSGGLICFRLRQRFRLR